MRRRLDVRRRVPRLRGTFAPFSRASDSPIAIACLRLVTRFPLRPLFSVPRLRRRIADLTLFDPEKVIDRSTYEQPFQYPEGIEYVVVNGQVALDHGKPTGAKPGRAIRRTP